MRRITYTVDRITPTQAYALWRPRSRAAAVEKAREASLRHGGRFAATAFHPVDAGPLSYRHGETVAVFEDGDAFREEQHGSG